MVMGWHVSVSRQTRRRHRPAANNDPQGVRLAVWQARVEGLDWLEELVGSGDAVHVADNGGYPVRYTVRAGAAIPRILDGPPDARTSWAIEPTDIIIDADRWPGRTMVDHRAIEACQPDEWLQVEAWDES